MKSQFFCSLLTRYHYIVGPLALAIATIDINDGAKIEREHRAESLARAECT